MDGTVREWWAKAVRRLLARRRSPATGLALPQYDGASLPNLARTLVEASGQRLPDGPALPALSADLDPFQGRRAEGPVVLLLLDGWGGFAFAEWLEMAGPSGAAWRAAARAITSVFPTTTTTALTSLSTAASPGQHGVVGHRLYLPAVGDVVDLLRMEPVSAPAGTTVDPAAARLSAVPPIFARGVRGAVYSRERFEGTGFTRTLYDGADWVGWATLGDFAHALGDRLRHPRPPPLVYAYYDDLDTTLHLRGPEPGLAAGETERLRAFLRQVASRAGTEAARRATVVLTADHGVAPGEPARTIRVEPGSPLYQAMARPLSGDRRAAYFAARPGRMTELDRALAEFGAPGQAVVELAVARAEGWFGPGPSHPELAARTGDRLVLPPPPWSYVEPDPRRTPRRPLLGHHGGLTDEELAVPLVTASLAELAGLGG